MLIFIKKRFLSQKKLSTNIYNLIGNFILTVILYLLGTTLKIEHWIVVLVSILFLVRASFSAICIIKFWRQK